MALVAGAVGGVGWSSSMRVKKMGSLSGIAGSYVQLENDANACGVFLINDAGASTTLYVAVADSAPTGDTGSIELSLTGAVYLHNTTPNRVYVKRASGTNTVTVRYITYV